MEVIKSKVTISAIDFLNSHAPDRQQPGDITTQMAVEKWGYSESQCRKKLNKLAKENKLTKHDGAILDNGEVGTVWRVN